MIPINLTFLPFLVSFLVAATVVPLTIVLFVKKGFVIDAKKTPHPAHTHTGKVPKGGGVGIYLAVLAVILFFIGLDRHTLGIVMAMTITLVVGLIDDIKGLSPKVRLLGNFLASGFVVASGIGISFVSNPFGGVVDLSSLRISFDYLGRGHEIWVLADLFAILWIPFLMNAINFSSGIDGQASGVIVIASAVVGLLSLRFSADITQWPVAILAFGTAGAFAALTVYHFFPQRIMPGYSATTLAGLLLGILSILSTTKVGTAMMVLSLPLIDATYAIARRVLSGKSPFMGDRGHLHHKLLEMGWGKRRITAFYWLTTGALGILALQAGTVTKIFVILALAIAIISLFLWIYFGTYLKQHARASG